MPELTDDTLDPGVDDAFDDALDAQDGDSQPDEEKDLAEEGDVEAKDSDDDDETEAKDKDGDKDKPKSMGSRVDRRIGQLTREKNDARREAEYWKREAEQRAAAAEAWLRNQQAQPGANGQPQPSNEQIEAKAREIAQQTIAAEQFQSRVTTLTQKLTDAGASTALERLSNAQLTAFEQEAVIALTEAKFPVEIAKAIAGNEDLFTRFSSLRSGVERARFIDRLDGRIEARREARAKGGTEVKTTRGVRGAARPVEKHPDDMSQAEYEAYRKKQGWA